jgi:hypothetical protein
MQETTATVAGATAASDSTHSKTTGAQMRDEDYFPTRAADEEVALEDIVNACDDDGDEGPLEDQERLFLQRLHQGWTLDERTGRLHPPKLSDLSINPAHLGSGEA